ncbi:MAG TPA: hypothetical protein VLY83_05335 [Methanoregula sp.]|nr:hypothetical protein [Methanoregula sp.]
MRWFRFLLIAAAVAAIVPGASAATVLVNATPQIADIGDVVTINGSITGISTIAVYLFVTGPGLDARGVTLENLNIPAGRGLFTTAPVNLSDGSFTYRWDTSVILGSLQPGNYTLYVVSSPVDRFLYQKEDFATTTIEFVQGGTPVTGTPLDPALPLSALGIAATGVGIAAMKKRKD